jgi:hypothetical protein
VTIDEIAEYWINSLEMRDPGLRRTL